LTCSLVDSLEALSLQLIREVNVELPWWNWTMWSTWHPQKGEYENKSNISVQLCTELFYAIFPTLFPCFLLIC